MSIDYWWTDPVRRKLKYSEQDDFQCLFVHCKSKTDWPGIEPLESGSQQFRKFHADRALDCGVLSYDTVKSFVRLLKFQRNAVCVLKLEVSITLLL
jgi:hypothetical protein